MKATRPENPLTTLESIRNNRTYILRSCDWTQTADSPLTDAKKTEWATYRQALRDIPSQYTDDDNFKDVIFPTQPN